MSQIDWAAEFITSRTLEYLLYKCGRRFIDAHRALNDSDGLLGLLLENLPNSGKPVFATLLEKARERSSRLHAIGAPYDMKDVLKGRGYRWQDAANGKPKYWWREVPETSEAEELHFLAENVFPGGNTESVTITRIDALSRFSQRALL